MTLRIYLRSIESQWEMAFPATVVLAVAASLFGCGGGTTSSSSATNPVGSSGGGTAPPSAASSFYVVENYLPPQPAEILQFSRTANGNVSPTSTITGPANLGVTAMTIDQSGNLYVGGQVISGATTAGAEVVVYGPEANGTATPSQTITTGLHALSTTSVYGLAVDSAQNLYVATDVEVGSGPSGQVDQGIAVFPAANANTGPSKSIAGPATEIDTPTQLAVDSAGNLYIADTGAVGGPGSILIFNSAATGNLPPTNVLAGSKTTIYNTQGVAVDSAGNIYVSSIGQTPLPTNALGGTPSILKFSAGSIGNVAPIQTISGPATTMGIIGNLRVDSAGNIYVLNGSTILRFAAGATGNVAPAATISSSAFFQTNGPIAVQ